MKMKNKTLFKAKSLLEINEILFDIEILIKSLESSQDYSSYKGNCASLNIDMYPYHTTKFKYNIEVPLNLTYSHLYELKKFYTDKREDYIKNKEPLIMMAELSTITKADIVKCQRKEKIKN